MPVIKVTLIEGYDAETVAALSRRMTDAVRATIAAVPEAITVITEEVPATHYMRGGQARVPGPATPATDDVVRDFLAAMEARDLEAARGFLGDGFEMVFPGGRAMTELDELVAWSKTRYQSVSKSFEGFDLAFSGDSAVVWCRGMLSGIWIDGTPFEGIRFVDRFEVVAGKIARQAVWNDLAEARPAS